MDFVIILYDDIFQKNNNNKYNNITIKDEMLSDLKKIIIFVKYRFIMSF